MALAQPPPPSADQEIVSTWRRHRVQIRKLWTDEWTDWDYLRAASVTDCAGPSLPVARLFWQSGTIKHEDQDDFVAEPLLDLKDWYVQVLLEGINPAGDAGTQGERPAEEEEIQPVTIFVGIVPDEELELGGDQQEGGHADQSITAVGLAHLLDRVQLGSCWVTNDGTTAVQIQRCIPFNERFVRGFAEVGNRSSSKITTDLNAGKTDADGNPLPEKNATSYVFSRGPADGSAPGTTHTWTVHDILEYLLAYHHTGEPTFTLSGQVDAIQSIVYPRVEWDGNTIKGMLDELIDRRRGLGWSNRLTAQTDGEGAVIGFDATLHVFTVIDEAVAVGDVKIPANQQVTKLPLNRNIRIEQCVIAVDSLTRYGTIDVQGEPIVVCFTVSFADQTLEKVWTAGEETASKAGAGGDDKDLNDAARAADALRHVWTTYRIPKAWGWQAGGGDGSGSKSNANPQVNDDGSLDATSSPPVRNWGQTLLEVLPLKAANTITEFDREYRRPFALVQDPVSEKWVHADRVRGTDRSPCHLRVLDKEFGIELNPTMNHMLAKDSWSGANASNDDPQFDYRQVIATVAAQTDRRLSVTAPVKGGDPARVLTIRVPDAQLWYVVPNTVTDVDATGDLVRRNGPARSDPPNPATDLVVRDDAPRLRQIAALAKVWYGKPRARVRVTLRQMGGIEHVVGSYVTSVEDVWRSEPINAVVTTKIFDLERGTTSIETNYSELDPSFMSPGKGAVR